MSLPALRVLAKIASVVHAHKGFSRSEILLQLAFNDPGVLCFQNEH